MSALTYDHPRSRWTTTKTRAHRFNTKVLGTYLHHPGATERRLAGETDDQIARRLLGYREWHVNGKGWLDIAYGAAVDWRGHTWELRGLDRESGANGGTVSNNHGAAILLLIGDREVPTQEMITGTLRLLAQIKATRPTVTWVRGHQQSPDAGGECPGSAVMGLLAAGRFHYRGPSTAPAPAPAAPAPAAALTVDGRLGTATVRALQEWLNRAHGAGLAVDGKAGPATWRALQVALGAPHVDGVISRQSHRASALGNGITGGWRYTGAGSRGSQTIVLLQRLIRATPDGIMGEGTIRALQRFLNGQR